MDWRLRRASIDDAAAVALVAGASFLETFAPVLAGADIVAHVARTSSPEKIAEWIAGEGHATLAEHPVAGAPVGYTLLTPTDLPVAAGAADIELRRIYALGMTRGTGLGAALLARALEDARALGKRRMLLGVLGTNGRARDFYERHGFVLVGERRFLVGANWHDDVVYARDI